TVSVPTGWSCRTCSPQRTGRVPGRGSSRPSRDARHLLDTSTSSGRKRSNCVVSVSLPRGARGARRAAVSRGQSWRARVDPFVADVYRDNLNALLRTVLMVALVIGGPVIVVMIVLLGPSDPVVAWGFPPLVAYLAVFAWVLLRRPH